MSLFRKCMILLAGLAAGQVMAKTVTHTVVSSISTTVADSLEKELDAGDTLWIRADDGLSTLGTGMNLAVDNLTLILEADADRDGTGTLAAGFSLKSTGNNTQVRVLMGKNSSVNGTVTTPYHKQNYPYIIIGPNPDPVSNPYKFDLNNTAQLNVLYTLNTRSDFDALNTVLASDNGPFFNALSNKQIRYGYALGQDIDLGATATSIMASSTKPFRGVLDGFHHSLDKMKFSSTANTVGLFATTRYAIIRNLNFTNLALTAVDYVGAVAGNLDSSSLVQNVQTLSGSISGRQYVAGLVGVSTNSSTISNVLNKASITGSSSAAGIVGYNLGNLDHLENQGSITSASGSAAGIVTFNPAAKIILYSVNFGTITGNYASGIISQSDGHDTLQYTYNYGAINGSTEASGLVSQSSAFIQSGLNNAIVLSTSGKASGICSSTAFDESRSNMVLNTGKISGKNMATPVYAIESYLRNFMNTGDVLSSSGYARGACYSSVSARFLLVSAQIQGVDVNSTEAVCPPRSSGVNTYAVFNSSMAPNVTNSLNKATPLDHSTIRDSISDFASYPEPDSFKVFWHAPTTYTLPTPKDLFPNGRIYKKLRQDVLVRATTAAFTMDSIQSYLPTYGTDWTYLCKTRSGIATCTKGASNLTITQNYNVTGNETLVLEATHASGLVVRDSLLLTFSTVRKSAPELSTSWPAQIVVTEGTPTLIDLSKFITDADGEAMTYVASPSQYVTSDISNGVWTLMYNNLVGSETLTLQATDAGSRTSPLASVAVSVSTLPKLVQALPTLALAKTEVRVISLKTHFFDADGDALVYTLSGQKNTEAQITGDVLQIVMNSDQGDSLVITATDDDGHSIPAGLKVEGTASALLASTPASALWFQTARQQLTVHAAQHGTAQLLIRDIAGETRHTATLHLRQGISQHSLPALPSGNYLITLRQGSQDQTQAWKQP